MIIRRIRTISFEVTLAWFLTFPSGWTTSPGGVSFRKPSSVILCRRSRSRRGRVAPSFHVDCLRGENCKSLLLNTVLLLSIDSIPPFSFTSFHSYSCLNPLIPDHEVLCSDHLIKASSCHCLQLVITWLRSILIYFLFMHCQNCLTLRRLRIRTLYKLSNTLSWSVSLVDNRA